MPQILADFFRFYLLICADQTFLRHLRAIYGIAPIFFANRQILFISQEARVESI